MATTQVGPTLVNGVAVNDLFDTIDAIKTTPAIAQFKFRIRNQWVDASHNRSTVDTFHSAGQQLGRPKPFVLEADEPQILLGKDMAANPVEHLLHALAACLTPRMWGPSSMTFRYSSSILFLGSFVCRTRPRAFASTDRRCSARRSIKPDSIGTTSSRPQAGGQCLPPTRSCRRYVRRDPETRSP